MQHYTKNTVSVAQWCNFCRRQTQHTVSGGRVGLCTEGHPRASGMDEHEFGERAAIMELDGGLTRAEAEREARIIVNPPGFATPLSKLTVSHNFFSGHKEEVMLLFSA